MRPNDLTYGLRQEQASTEADGRSATNNLTFGARRVSPSSIVYALDLFGVMVVAEVTAVGGGTGPDLASSWAP